MAFATVATGYDGEVVVEHQTDTDGAHRLVVDGVDGDAQPAGRICTFGDYRGVYVDPLGDPPEIFKITSLIES